MAFKDALLQLSSYPEPNSAESGQAVVFAEAAGACISVLAFKIDVPDAHKALANTLFDFPGMVEAGRQNSAKNVPAPIGAFETMATKRGIRREQMVGPSTTSQFAATVTTYAKIYDITMMPMGRQTALHARKWPNYLARHGAGAILEEEEAAGCAIGQALEATAHDLDVMVMGPYRHSRMGDLILGAWQEHRRQPAAPSAPFSLMHKPAQR